MCAAALLLVSGCAAGFYRNAPVTVAYFRVGDTTAVESLNAETSGGTKLTIGKLDSDRAPTWQTFVSMLAKAVLP